MTNTTWHGRRGAVLLGPTEHRVARWLHEMTRHGRIAIRTTDLMAALGLERSEAYRITGRLRVLGLFGVENDRGGSKGGRRYWRTSIEHDGAQLDPARKRVAWARIVGWARLRSERTRERLATLRATTQAGQGVSAWALGRPASSPAPLPPGTGELVSFGEALRRHGLGAWIDDRRLARG